jgi:hypothetical protein
VLPQAKAPVVSIIVIRIIPNLFISTSIDLEK